MPAIVGSANTSTAAPGRGAARSRVTAPQQGIAFEWTTPLLSYLQTIHKTKVPIIAICNDKYSTKLKSLRNHTLELDFRK